MTAMSAEARTTNETDEAYLRNLPERSLVKEVMQRHNELEREEDGTYVPGAKLDAYTAARRERESRAAPRSAYVSTADDNRVLRSDEYSRVVSRMKSSRKTLKPEPSQPGAGSAHW